MLINYLNSANAQISALQRFLHIYENPTELDSIFAEMPFRGDTDVLMQERILRHCAVITRLYSIYENMTKSCVHHWLTKIPTFAKYDDISDRLKKAYYDGLPKIISKSNSRKYEHLNITQELKKYVNAIEGGDPWEFVPEAISHQESNLRNANLEKILNLVTTIDFRSYMTNDDSINNVINSSSSRKSFEAWIDDLVTYRNDAAHGTPDEILGMDELSEYLYFVSELCKSIVKFMKYNACLELKQQEGYRPCGEVVEVYSNNISVGRLESGIFEVGQTLSFFRENYYEESEILSIQLNDTDFDTVEITTAGTELGFMMTKKIPNNSTIFEFVHSI